MKRQMEWLSMSWLQTLTAIFRRGLGPSEDMNSQELELINHVKALHPELRGVPIAMIESGLLNRECPKEVGTFIDIMRHEASWADTQRLIRQTAEGRRAAQAEADARLAAQARARNEQDQALRAAQPEVLGPWGWQPLARRW